MHAVKIVIRSVKKLWKFLKNWLTRGSTSSLSFLPPLNVYKTISLWLFLLFFFLLLWRTSLVSVLLKKTVHWFINFSVTALILTLANIRITLNFYRKWSVEFLNQLAGFYASVTAWKVIYIKLTYYTYWPNGIFHFCVPPLFHILWKC